MDDRYRFNVLGPLEVYRGEDELAPPRGLEAVLLHFLLLHRRDPAPDDSILTALWPETRPDKANLHTLIKLLRRALEPQSRHSFSVLVRERGYYRLRFDDEQIDSHRFERLVTEGEAQRAEDIGSARNLLETAISLWRGSPHREAYSHDFAIPEVERLTSIYQKARVALFEIAVACGEAAAVLPDLRAFYLDPANQFLEPRALMRAYIAVEEWAQAEQTFNEYHNEHELDVSEEFLSLYRDYVLAPRTAISEISDSTRGSDKDAVDITTIQRYLVWVKKQVKDLDIRWALRDPRGRLVNVLAADLYVPPCARSGPAHMPPPQQRTPLQALLSQLPRLLILGESGCGKSFFLRHLARQYADNADGLIPISVRAFDLKGVAARRQTGSDTGALSAAVASQLPEGSLSSDQIYRLAEEGRVLWLIDGLNDLTTLDERAAVVRLLETASRQWDSCSFVVTSGSETPMDAVPLGFDVAEVDLWRREDMKAFLTLLTLSAFPEEGEDEREGIATRVLSRILDEPELRDLASNPLHFTAMAVLELNGRALSGSRAELLEAIIGWLLQEREAGLRELLGSVRKVEEAFRVLAYAMTTNTDEPQVQVGRLWAASVLEPLFPGKTIDVALLFIDRAETASGLLVRRGSGDVGFQHELFRDYLAAKYISGKTDSLEDGWWSDIRDHIDDPGWRNILRLIPICLLRQGRDRVDLFFELLGRSCDGRSFSERARRVALGGKVLQELRRLGYETKPVSAWHNETANVGGVFEISPDLPDLTTRFETAVAIGLEGDPRLSDFDATWTSLPSGAFFMGAQSSDPAAECFDRDSAPWEAPVREITIEGFDVRRYPVTVADYSEFLDSGGYSEEGVGFWSTEAWQWRTVSRVSSPLDWDRQLDMPNAPITGISWFEAVAYCAWLSSVPEARFTYRLPYESEWEYAAKHGVPKGQQFAWGNRMTYGDDAEANWAGCYLRQKSPVGVFPRSTTEDGIADLFGNVEEWCLDEWRATIPDEPPYEADDRFPSVFRLVRGGSTIRFSRLCRPSYRGRILQHRRYHTVGFRPVRVL